MTSVPRHRPRRRKRVPGYAIAIVALVIVLAACRSVVPNTLVSGWSVGEVVDCTNDDCLDWVAAEAGLAQRYPDHLPVASLTIHEEGSYVRPDGTVERGHLAGGCCRVALFQFVDGSMLAFGVGSALIGDTPRPVFEPPFADEAE